MKEETPAGQAGAFQGDTTNGSNPNTNGANARRAQRQPKPAEPADQFDLDAWLAGGKRATARPGGDDDNIAAEAQANQAAGRKPWIDAQGQMNFAIWVQHSRQRQQPAGATAGDYQPPVPTAGADRYAGAALADECAAVAGTVEGSRNHRLNTAAFNLGSLVLAGALDRGQVEQALGDAARACGLTDHEIGPTIASGFSGAATKVGARQIPEPAGPDLGDTDVGDLGAGSGDGGDGDGGHAAAVVTQLQWLRARAEAQRIFDAEQRPPISYPPTTGLQDLLAEPDEPTRYTVDQLAPAGGRVLLAAQYKAGKTTMVGNVARSIADAEPFLGEFTTAPGHRLALIDNELSRDNVRRWLRAQQIRNISAIADVVTLRGNVAAFNLLDDAVRAHWAQRFRDLGITYLILDCLRPMLDALGLDEHRDAGRFLIAFDTLLAEAGITDALVVHHMGHNGERARGDSRLLDWPDAIWRVVRDRDDNPDDPAAPRYFSAYGRDVDVAEARLDYTPEGRRLTYSAGSSRRTAKADAARPALIAVLAGQDLGDGLTQNQLRERLRDEHGVSFHAARAVIAGAVKDGTVVQTPGPNRSTLHFLNPSERAAAGVAAADRNTAATP